MGLTKVHTRKLLQFCNDLQCLDAAALGRINHPAVANEKRIALTVAALFLKRVKRFVPVREERSTSIQ